jgi:hypothetical protein
MSKDKIQFIASLPSATAIKIDGQDGNAKIIFETDSTQLPQVIKLVLKVGQSFKVIIEDE